jgi:hypothetical protein
MNNVSGAASESRWDNACVEGERGVASRGRPSTSAFALSWRSPGALAGFRSGLDRRGVDG